MNFETSLFTAQTIGNDPGRLDARGANGGPQALVTQPFFISANSSVHFLVSAFEQPGGLVTPGDGKFNPAIFNTFGAWTEFPDPSPRAAVARGELIFNSRPINITGVAGINDDIAAGGLVAGGVQFLQGTCGTCHDTPNVGNHSFPTPLDIGTGDPSPSNASVNMGGLDVSYLPSITVCKLDTTTTPPSRTTNCKTTTDLGQGLIDGRFDHIGKIKGPIRGSVCPGSLLPQWFRADAAGRGAFLPKPFRPGVDASRSIRSGGVPKLYIAHGDHSPSTKILVV